ncbi:hypothetical protein E2562_019202 [Oryza meyeriana var. granulata]|uniref:Uncharacterized protein n=1 Tax=Oryza meyeriana var. granulata TaxID=110450 RepID=A0A6G1FA34_9ORYZ|nr:hypothetical protein E2562_019202 [Oryza meyeriana var. granulata]
MHLLVEALVEVQERWWGDIISGGVALRHVVVWTGVLALAVSMASFAPKATFVWALLSAMVEETGGRAWLAWCRCHSTATGTSCASWLF